MKLEAGKVYTNRELKKEIQSYLHSSKKLANEGYQCQCGEPLRQGFVNSYPVDKDLKLAAVDGFVVIMDHIVEPEPVLQAGTTAAFHVDP